ncbi:MAG: O-antigen ligase family protein [Planctomycetota bacterium]
MPTDDRLRAAAGAKPWLRAHLAASVLLTVGLTLPTTFMEFSVVPLVLVCLVGIQHTHRGIDQIFREPAVIPALALSAWIALGLVWSPDPAQGGEELASLRWLLAIPLLRPAVNRHRRALVLALLAGFALGHAVQVINAVAVFSKGPDWLIMGRTTTRLSGWWDPAVAGTTLTAAVGLALAGAIWGRGKDRLIGCASLLLAIAGLLATGSRGGWLATAALLTTTAVIAIAAAPESWRGKLTLGAAGLAAVIAIAAVIARPVIAPRVESAARDIRLALDDDNYQSDTGGRILMKELALDLAARHAITGVGTGGFGVSARELAEQRDLPERVVRVRVHDHAHDTPLHLVSTNGLIGLVLGAWLIAGITRSALATRNDRTGFHRGFQHGPALALLGLAFAMPFDTLYVSAHAVSLTGFLIALAQIGLTPGAPRTDDL